MQTVLAFHLLDQKRKRLFSEAVFHRQMRWWLTKEDTESKGENGGNSRRYRVFPTFFMMSASKKSHEHDLPEIADGARKPESRQIGVSIASHSYPARYRTRTLNMSILAKNAIPTVGTALVAVLFGKSATRSESVRSGQKVCSNDLISDARF
ncbi:hypothetical protein [Chlorobaculum sp. 24CR]|uniref:hypothetical protein n=1 Tax=Chlorobaculum sp. 24CR TaxID=2508878 RepID=UPI0014309F3D|nr:hypothetical protein [Chlorobaculum sp. 24CR]